MTDTTEIARMAQAMMEAAREFYDPVNLYVVREYQHRWGQENPGKDWVDDGPFGDCWGTDREELEGWKILARAARSAMRVPPATDDDANLSGDFPC